MEPHLIENPPILGYFLDIDGVFYGVTIPLTTRAARTIHAHCEASVSPYILVRKDGTPYTAVTFRPFGSGSVWPPIAIRTEGYSLEVYILSHIADGLYMKAPTAGFVAEMA